MLDRISAWYTSGKWSAEQVQAAVARGWISQDQANLILAPQ